jgi:hypothetical protein
MKSLIHEVYDNWAMLDTSIINSTTIYQIYNWLEKLEGEEKCDGPRAQGIQA